MNFPGHGSKQCQAPEGKFLIKLLCRKSLLPLPPHTLQTLNTFRNTTADFWFFLFSVSRYIYTRIISHHVLLKSISFLQILTSWKIVLQNEKQSQTKISLWVLLKKTATEMSIWHRQDRRQQPRESIQESLRMKQFLLFWTAHMNPDLGNKHSLGGAAVGHAAQGSAGDGIAVLLFLGNFTAGSCCRGFTVS